MTSNPAPPTMKSDEEWKKLLTPEQFHVARQHGTERPFSSPLNRRETHGSLQMRVLRRAALFVEHQVRFGHRLAQLLGAGR